MPYRLHRLGLVTATLLLSLNSTIKLAGTSLGISVASAQAQTPQARKAEALRLNQVGIQQLNTGQFREALQTFEQVLGIVRAIGERPVEGTTLNYIGLIYEKLGQYSQALNFHEQALVIRQQLGDKAGEGETLNNFGVVYSSVGDYTTALKYYERALVIAKQVGDQAMEGITLYNIGALFYTHLKQYTQALKYYQQALSLQREAGDKVGEWMILHNIGAVYSNLGQYTQALKSYEQVLVIAKQLGNKAEEGSSLTNIGGIYNNLGQYPKALKSYEQALIIARQIGNKAVEGATLNNIGVVYTNLGQYAEAFKSFMQALVIAEKIGDKAGKGKSFINIGEVYRNLNQYPQALKLYEQALVIHQQLGDKSGEGEILNNIGAIYNHLEQYAQALKFHEQALTIARQIGNKANEGTILNNIGQAYFSLGQHPNALNYYQQALVIHRKVGSKAGEWSTLSNMGAVYISLGQYPDAEKTLLTAIEVSESLRPGLTDASKISFFERQAQAYRFLQQSLVAQNKTNHALEIAERGRARAFVELLAERFPSTTIVPSLVSLEPPINPPEIPEIQQIAKEQNATLVEYSIVNYAFNSQRNLKWYPSELYIWVVKPSGEVVFKSVDLKFLNTSLKDLIISSRDSIGVRGRGLGVMQRVDAATQVNQLQQLHKLLIEPIAQFLPSNPSDRIIFIPQNELFLVPFAALQDEKGKFLIEKHTILTAPAIQVLELTRKQRQQVTGKDVLIVGNPSMPSISPKIGEPPQKLPSLPGAEAEAKAIAQLFNTTALTGNQATKTTVKQQMKKARIIHLATHGLLDDFKGQGVPGAIALAPDSQTKGEAGEINGLLSSSDILDLKLNAELVVLSACDTGRGTITGDGVIGLSRSLISAGAPSVIVSLWSVPDSPTASLMTEFYRQLQQNSDKATALRQAMLTTMKQHPNPRDWAAFTLIGEAE